MPVCTLTACNGRLCRWGEGQKKIQDVHRYIAQNFKRLSLEAASTFQLAGNLADSSTLAKIALGAPAPAVH